MNIFSRFSRLTGGTSQSPTAMNRILEVVKTIRFARSPRLYGRTSSGAGNGEEISVGYGLVLENEELRVDSSIVGGASSWDQLTGTASKVPFTTTNGGPTALGELAWLAETETLCLRLKNGENLDVGEETIYHVENATGSTITKGTAVSYAGTVGGSGKIRVKPWNGSTDAPEAFMGIAMGDIANNSTGYVTAFGQVRGVNTSAFSDGVILYANPSGTGLTATKPSATHVIACLCVRAANNGTLLVRPVVSEVATWDSVTGKPTVIVEGDARLTNSREWSAETISQVEAEAGTSTTRRAFTAQRVFQAIAAWWNASAFKTKLDGIASGATANQTDAFLLSRANHTGTQLASTISDFNSAVASTPPASHTHPISQVVGLQTALDNKQAAGNYVLDSDSRLSDARTPLAHSHGNITNSGTIGTTADLVVTTTTGGALTVASRSGIDSRTSFPNADVTAATSSATPDTLVRRDTSGGASMSYINANSPQGFVAAVSGQSSATTSGLGSYFRTTSSTVVGSATAATRADSTTLGVFALVNPAFPTPDVQLGGYFIANNGIGARFGTITGTYDAIFGVTAPTYQSGVTGARSFIARVRGAFGWFRGQFTGRIAAADTLTSDRTWDLPDASGTLAIASTQAQTFLNALPASIPSAILNLDSSTQALKLPSMTETQRNAITSPVAGLLLYNTTTNRPNFHNGSAWVAL